mgnify:CR=1 FL=1
MRAANMAKLTDDARSQAFQRLRAGDKQDTDQGEAAALVKSLPDDGVVCDHDAGALRLSQVTSKRLS